MAKTKKAVKNTASNEVQSASKERVYSIVDVLEAVGQMATVINRFDDAIQNNAAILKQVQNLTDSLNTLINAHNDLDAQYHALVKKLSGKDSEPVSSKGTGTLNGDSNGSQNERKKESSEKSQESSKESRQSNALDF